MFPRSITEMKKPWSSQNILYVFVEDQISSMFSRRKKTDQYPTKCWWRKKTKMRILNWLQSAAYSNLNFNCPRENQTWDLRMQHLIAFKMAELLDLFKAYMCGGRWHRRCMHNSDVTIVQVLMPWNNSLFPVAEGRIWSGLKKVPWVKHIGIV